MRLHLSPSEFDSFAQSCTPARARKFFCRGVEGRSRLSWNANGILRGTPFTCAGSLSEAENAKLYGKCNNPLGHGHGYLTETTIGGEYDERSGTLYDFVAFRKAIQESLEPWRDRHLDLETEDFHEAPSTGENIVRALWPKIDNRVNQQLVRLRLWETPNNRFALEKNVATLMNVEGQASCIRFLCKDK